LHLIQPRLAWCYVPYQISVTVRLAKISSVALWVV